MPKHLGEECDVFFHEATGRAGLWVNRRSFLRVLDVRDESPGATTSGAGHGHDAIDQLIRGL
jgi:hypothetical protein